ncbi:MAG: GMC family oxidoreductase N-terminal domain-containing protein [Gammaproteobacteria bacterium]|nr:GMC family oxidoreductase N-terminal domain-containing protein [Gammaproteobacteria bacterium]
MAHPIAFDYVIVGAGSAGCVLANRLSANAKNSVCLLEAGPADRSLFIQMPVGIGYLLPGKQFNLHHYTEPQQHLNERRLFWPRGRTLGGSSAINAMIYTRGNATDYDNWENAGNPGWGWRGILPYFLLAEGNERGSDAYHNRFGPLAVSDLKWKSIASTAFLRAAQSAGHPLNNDFNDNYQAGMGFYQVTQKQGRRYSAATAYLHPIANRPNLTVSTHKQVARILFKGDRAVALRLLNGQKILANKEIILSAGTIQSPQILLLSGIGPEAELKQWGIAPQVHLPGVGKNLQDHLDISQVIKSSDPIGFSTSLRSYLSSALALPNYLLLKRGNSTTTG